MSGSVPTNDEARAGALPAPPDSATRSGGRPLLAAASLGLLVGVAAKVADTSGPGWAADLGTFPAVWLAGLGVLAHRARTAAQAALRALAFFSTMCVGYYAWATWVLGYPESSRYALLWLSAALLVAAPVAAVLQRTVAGRGGDVVSGAALALAASVPLTSGSLRQLWWAAPWTSVPTPPVLRPVQALVDLAVAALLLLVLAGRRRVRQWALGLVVPAVLVVQGSRGHLAGFLGL